MLLCDLPLHWFFYGLQFRDPVFGLCTVDSQVYHHGLGPGIGAFLFFSEHDHRLSGLHHATTGSTNRVVIDSFRVLFRCENDAAYSPNPPIVHPAGFAVSVHRGPRQG